MFAVEFHIAEIAQRECIVAGSGHRCHQDQRFTQQVAGCIKAHQAAQRFCGLCQGSTRAAWPAAVARHVQSTLHPLKCRLVVVEAIECVANVGGGHNCESDLTGGERQRIGLAKVPDRLNVIAVLVGNAAPEIFDRICRRRVQIGA